MRSFVLALIALVLACANAQEFQRHRVAQGEAATNNVRGVNSKYMDLASEVDAEIQQRVQQRRFLMGKNTSEDEEEGEEMTEEPDMGGPEMGEPEMSMSMSMSM